MIISLQREYQHLRTTVLKSLKLIKHQQQEQQQQQQKQHKKTDNVLNLV